MVLSGQSFDMKQKFQDDVNDIKCKIDVKYCEKPEFEIFYTVNGGESQQVKSNGD